MKIEEIYIDGYKNIRKTKLAFSETQMIVLLAENNYGKTNLLCGILEGFQILRRQGSSSVDFIKSQRFTSVFEQEPNKKTRFTFKVKFKKKKLISIDNNLEEDNHSDDIYCYELIIDPNEPTGKDEFDEKMDNNYAESRTMIGIVKEELYIDKPEGKYWLFKRDKCSNYATVHLNGLDNKKGKRYSIYSKSIEKYTHISSIPHHSLRLFLHQFGNRPSPEDCNIENDLLETLHKIYGAYISLTNDRIGKIIIDENADLNNIEELQKELIDLEKNEFKQVAEDMKFLYGFTEMTRSCCNELPCTKDRETCPHKISIVRFRNDQNPIYEKLNTVSYGVRRMLKILVRIYSNKTPLITIECFENGIHENLSLRALITLQKAIKYCCENKPNNITNLIITSHSSAIVQCFTKGMFTIEPKDENKMSSLYFGVPYESNNRNARFARLTDDGIKETMEAVDKYGAKDVTSFINSHYSVDIFSKNLIEMLQEPT